MDSIMKLTAHVYTFEYQLFLRWTDKQDVYNAIVIRCNVTGDQNVRIIYPM